MSRDRSRRLAGAMGFSWQYDVGEERDAIGQRVSGYMFTVKDIVAPRSYVGTQMGYTEVLNSTPSGVFAAVYKVEESLLSNKSKLAVRCGPVEYIPAGGRALLLFARKAYSSLPGRTLYVYWHSVTTPSSELTQLWQELLTARNTVYQLPVPPRRVVEENKGRVNARAIRIQDLGNAVMPTVIQNQAQASTPARTKLKVTTGPNGVYQNNTIALLSLQGILTPLPRTGGVGLVRAGDRPTYRVLLRLSIFGRKKRFHGRLSSRIRRIIRSALYEYDIVSWVAHDRKKATVALLIRRKRGSARSVRDEVENIRDQFGDSAVDGWMEGDIRISSHSHRKDELGLAVESIRSSIGTHLSPNLIGRVLASPPAGSVFRK